MIVDEPTSARLASAPGAYDVSSIGGIVSEIVRMHRIRPEWDNEMVQEVLGVGGRPPLRRVVKVTQLEKYKLATIIVVQPSGEDVTAYIPISQLFYFYPETVGQWGK